MNLVSLVMAIALLFASIPKGGLQVVEDLVLPGNAGPADFAGGGVWYEAEGLERHISFNVHEAKGDRPAKGHLHYGDALGEWYNVDVSHVNVVGDMAYFAGEVASASMEAWEGMWLSAAVHDGGTPGRNGDHVWIMLTDMAEAVSNVDNQIAPGEMYAVFRGNLVVHAFDGSHGPPDWTPPGPPDDVPPGPPDGVPPGPPDDVPRGPPDDVPPGPPDWAPGKGH